MDVISQTREVTNRRDWLGRLGVAMVGVATANVLTARQASASCLPPGYPDCHGHDGCFCHGGGCTATPSGGCCWYYTDNVACRIYRCCDETCADGVTGICRYLFCHCC